MSLRAARGRATRADTEERPQPSIPAGDLSATLSARSLLFGSGPRFAGDALGPVLAFYVGWKLAGTVVGIGVATAVGVLAWYAERRRERPGAVALLALAFVFVQAGVGLAFGSARVYLAQQVFLSAGLGLAFLISIVVRRPLAGLFAQDIFQFPDEVRCSATFRRVFTRISLVWGVYQVLRSAVRLGALSKSTIDAYLVVNLITGVFVVALMAWSIRYAVRAFRRSEEWGWAIRGEQPPPDVVAAYEAQVSGEGRAHAADMVARLAKGVDEATSGLEALPMDGVVAGLYLSATAGGVMQHQDEVEVHAGGVVGDRYSSESGSWSSKPASGRALTLIEEEAIEAVRRDYGIDLVPGATRRNVVTRGVALNHLVGRTFQVGEVEVVGVRLAEPCAHLEGLTAKGVRRAFVHRGGLRGEVVSGGRMRVGDAVGILERPVGAE